MRLIFNTVNIEWVGHVVYDDGSPYTPPTNCVLTDTLQKSNYAEIPADVAISISRLLAAGYSPHATTGMPTK